MEEKKSAKRKRDKSFSLRMTEEEWKSVQEKFLKSKVKNQTDFFLKVLNKKPIIVVEELRPMLTELKKQGTNLNQIAKEINEGSDMNEGMKILLRDCWRLYDKLLKLEVKIK